MGALFNYLFTKKSNPYFSMHELFNFLQNENVKFIFIFYEFSHYITVEGSNDKCIYFGFLQLVNLRTVKTLRCLPQVFA